VLQSAIQIGEAVVFRDLAHAGIALFRSVTLAWAIGSAITVSIYHEISISFLHADRSKPTIIFMFGLLARIKPTILVYAAVISDVLFDCCAISLVPNMNMTKSGFAEESQPCKLLFAMLIARYPE